MDSKLINSINRNLNRHSPNTAVNNSGTTRWNEVFGEAQTKVTQEKTKQAYSNSSLNTYSGGTNSGITSLNLGINPQVSEYNKYKSFNDLEKKFQEKGYYKAEDITNPYHYTKTNNYFKDDIKKEFSDVYGNWDGYSEDEKGFAYIDKYGNSAISKNFFNALIYSKDGQIYNFDGDFKYGYAVDANGNRMWLAGLEGSTPYSNFNPINDKDKNFIETKYPGFFDKKNSVENDSYTDRFPYINKSLDAINYDKFNLWNIPIYYGRYTPSTSNNDYSKVSNYEW